MTPRSHCQPTLVNTSGHDEQGCLVFVDDRLVAVLVRLERSEHVEPELWGRWNVEVGFGPCQIGPRTVTFATRDEAQAWARERVVRGSSRGTRAIETPQDVLGSGAS